MTQDDTFTIHNALFGAAEITKNADTNKCNYKGHGIYFDEAGSFGHTMVENGVYHTTNARNVLMFGAEI